MAPDYKREQQAADELTARIKTRVGAKDWTEVSCPREGSYMSPCVGRDGGLAVADDGVCVFCGHRPSELLADDLAKHPVF